MDNRTWGYRLKNGEVEAQMFEDGLPDGWEDSPAKCKPKRGRPRKTEE